MQRCSRDVEIKYSEQSIYESLQLNWGREERCILPDGIIYRINHSPGTNALSISIYLCSVYLCSKSGKGIKALAQA